MALEILQMLSFSQTQQMLQGHDFSMLWNEEHGVSLDSARYLPSTLTAPAALMSGLASYVNPLRGFINHCTVPYFHM